MTGSTLNAVLFLISATFDFYLVVLFIRLLLVWKHADYTNPLTQFVAKLTDVVVKPLKRFLPMIGRFELATLVLMLIVATIKNLLVIASSFGLHNFVGVLILAVSDTLYIMLQTSAYALIIQAILSWVQPNSPNYYMLANLTSPILRPIQRILPPIGGIDLSLLIVFIILKVLVILLVNPLKAFGLAVALGTISLW